MNQLKYGGVGRVAPARRFSVLVVALVALGGLCLSLLIWALAYVGVFSVFAKQSLGDSITAFRNVTTVVEDTDGLCGTVTGTIPCVEGWRTGLGNFMQFRGEAMAEYWHLAIGGDSLRNGTVVVDMNGLNLSRDERELVVQMLFRGRDWE